MSVISPSGLRGGVIKTRYDWPKLHDAFGHALLPQGKVVEGFARACQ